VRYSYNSQNNTLPQRLVFILLKDLCVFPDVVAPLFQRPDDALTLYSILYSISILEDGLIGCVDRRDPSIRGPRRKTSFAPLREKGEACFD
jgi:hypothetical protein